MLRIAVVPGDGFDQYVNFRPARFFKSVTPPLRDKKTEEIGFVVVHENTEAEYSDLDRTVTTEEMEQAIVEEVRS